MNFVGMWPFWNAFPLRADILHIAMTTVGGFQIFAKHENQGKDARGCPPKMLVFMSSSVVYVQ